LGRGCGSLKAPRRPLARARGGTGGTAGYLCLWRCARLGPPQREGERAAGQKGRESRAVLLPPSWLSPPSWPAPSCSHRAPPNGAAGRNGRVRWRAMCPGWRGHAAAARAHAARPPPLSSLLSLSPLVLLLSSLPCSPLLLPTPQNPTPHSTGRTHTHSPARTHSGSATHRILLTQHTHIKVSANRVTHRRDCGQQEAAPPAALPSSPTTRANQTRDAGAPWKRAPPARQSRWRSRPRGSTTGQRGGRRVWPGDSALWGLESPPELLAPEEGQRERAKKRLPLRPTRARRAPPIGPPPCDARRYFDASELDPPNAPRAPAARRWDCAHGRVIAAVRPPNGAARRCPPAACLLRVRPPRRALLCSLSLLLLQRPAPLLTHPHRSPPKPKPQPPKTKTQRDSCEARGNTEDNTPPLQPLVLCRAASGAATEREREPPSPRRAAFPPPQGGNATQREGALSPPALRQHRGPLSIQQK
jgi:hypothetical protein